MYLLEARAKIERANVHIGDVERRVNALEQADTAVVEIHPEHGTERLTHTLDESDFNNLALFVGDAVHNLNCALDYTWLQTIEKLVPANVKDRAKFPVHKAVQELGGELRKGNVDATCPQLYTFTALQTETNTGSLSLFWQRVILTELRCVIERANGGQDPPSVLPKDRLIASTSRKDCTSRRRAS
jgi:hypothetical protein